MKSIYSITCLLMTLAIGFLSSCNGTNLDAEFISSDYLSVGTTLDVSGSASTDTIPIKANCSWKVESDVNWISIKSPEAGQGKGNQPLVLNVAASALDSMQVGHLTLKTIGGIQRIITVNQRAGNIKLTASLSSIYFTYDAGADQYLNITSNTQWTATSSAEWLHINNEKTINGRGDSRLTIHAEPNSNPEALTGTITIIDADHKIDPPIKIDVVIGGKSPIFKVTPANNVGAVGGTSTFGVQSNFNWQAAIESYSPATTEQWAHFANGNPTMDGNASSEGVLASLTIEPNKSLNERTVKIKVYTTEKDTVFAITQEKATLPVVYSPYAVSISMNEATLAFSATSSTFDITECGILYSTSQEDIMQGARIVGTRNGDETSTTLTALSSGTTYYVYAFATSSVGTAYSNIFTFTTRFTPGRDNNPTP